VPEDSKPRAVIRRLTDWWDGLPRWGRISLRLLEYGLALWLVFSISGCWFITHTKRAEVLQPKLSAEVYDDVEFVSEDGLRLSGWLLKAQQPLFGAVVCHGWQMNRMALFDRAMWLYERGGNVLVFDMRAHGRSAGELCSLGHHEVKDVRAAIGYLTERQLAGEPPRVFLWGHSMGAVACLLAADSESVRGVVAEAPFDNMTNSIGMFLKSRGHLPPIPLTQSISWMVCRRVGMDDPVDVRPACRRLKDVPVFLLTGGRDRVVSPFMATRVYESLGGPKRRFVVPEGTHNRLYLMGGEELRKELAEFLGLPDALRPPGGQIPRTPAPDSEGGRLKSPERGESPDAERAG